MCLQHEPVQHVRIVRCVHGTNFLTFGMLQLGLTDEELVLIARSIHALSYRHPELQKKLLEGICSDRPAQQLASDGRTSALPHHN